MGRLLSLREEAASCISSLNPNIWIATLWAAIFSLLYLKWGGLVPNIQKWLFKKRNQTAKRCQYTITELTMPLVTNTLDSHRSLLELLSKKFPPNSRVQQSKETFGLVSTFQSLTNVLDKCWTTYKHWRPCSLRPSSPPGSQHPPWSSLRRDPSHTSRPSALPPQINCRSESCIPALLNQLHVCSSATKTDPPLQTSIRIQKFQTASLSNLGGKKGRKKRGS